MRTYHLALLLVLFGCGAGVTATVSDPCKDAQDKVQATWQSAPDKVSGNVWTYVEEGVGTFNYRFEIQPDGTCKTATSGSSSNESTFALPAGIFGN